MKKALIYSLSLALLLSLTACHRAQADQPDASQPDPAAVSTPADVSTPEPEKPAAPEQLSSKTGLSEITHDELLNVFQQEYDTSKDLYHSDSEDTIQGELLAIQITVEGMGKALPSDYEAQYRAWRPSAAQQDAQENPQVPQNNADTSTAPAEKDTQTSKGSITTQTQTQTQTKTSGDTQQPQDTQDNYTSDGVYMGPDASQVYDDTKSTEPSSPNPWDGADLLIGYGENPGTGSSIPQEYKPGGIKEAGK